MGTQQVESLSGPRSPGELGRALVGERLVSAPPGYDRFVSAETVRAAALAGAPEACGQLGAAGVETVVDTTPLSAGRDVSLLRELADALGATLICATGFPDRHELPAALATLPATALADLMLAELAEGADGSASRPGVIVLGGGDDPTELDETMLLAVAFAYAESGAPVVVRGGGEAAAWRVERLLGRGVDPERVVVCDLDRPALSFALLERLARSGVGLGFSAIGDEALDAGARAALVAHALRRYGAERVFLSTACALVRVSYTADGWSCEQVRGYDVLAPFIEQLGGFGMSGEEIAAAMAAGARRLFTR